MKSMRSVSFQKCHPVSCDSCALFYLFNVLKTNVLFFADIRGQKHEVELNIKMGLEAKNYETVSRKLNLFMEII